MSACGKVSQEVAISVLARRVHLIGAGKQEPSIGRDVVSRIALGMKYIIEIIQSFGVTSCLTDLTFRCIDLYDKRVACACLGDTLYYSIVGSWGKSKLAILDLLTIDIKTIVGSAFNLDCAFGKRTIGKCEASKRNRHCIGIRWNDTIGSAHTMLHCLKIGMQVKQ